MAAIPGPTTGRADTQVSARPVANADEIPRHADGVQLIGEMKGSGYRETPALARRSDGQTIQLTPLLNLVLSRIDGIRTLEEVAAEVSDAYGRTVTADNVRTLVDRQLRPVGLLTCKDGSQPQLRRSNPLLGLRFKYAVSDPDRTRRLTAPFARLFHPLVVTLVLAAFLLVCWWVFVEKGLAAATHEAFEKPGLLLLVFVVTVLSAGFHEFGHAAGARRGGATPGAMGAGVYLVWPAFYTDVTDSYRLGRAGRVRTDLGGLYFNAIVAVAVAGVWWITRYDALLLVVATQILQMIRQLTPLVRFDGYHVLADVTGVPDLFHRIKPTLLGLLPWRWRHPETTVLKPWARAVVSLWVLAVIPVLAFTLFVMMITLPRILGTAWAALGKQAGLLDRAWSDTDLPGVAVRLLAMLAVAFPILALGIVLVGLIRRVVTSTLRRTEGKPVRRVVAGLAAVAVLAGLAWTWWPHPGTYRPVQPYEGGTLVQAGRAAASTLSTFSPSRPGPSGLVEGQHGRMVAAWPDGDPRPTPEQPQLALIIVPHGYDATATPIDANSRNAIGGEDVGRVTTGEPANTGTPANTGRPANTGHPWVFPFDKPLQPGEGDNQALAVNTTDNTITYDVAFALVWVEGDVPALNRNEASALASCTNCAAVAIGFQVVLVIGDNHVAAPQNISAAINYDCVNCLTYALAVQLFVTLDGPLSDAARADITALWDQIAAFGTTVADVPLDEIRSRISAYEQQILQIIEQDQGTLTPGQAPAAPVGAGESASGAPTGTAAPTPSPTSDGTSVAPGSTAAPVPADTTSPGAPPPEPAVSPTGGPDASNPTATDTVTGAGPAVPSLPTASAEPTPPPTTTPPS